MLHVNIKALSYVVYFKNHIGIVAVVGASLLSLFGDAGVKLVSTLKPSVLPPQKPSSPCSEVIEKRGCFRERPG